MTVVNLSVHRNTKEKRERRSIQDRLLGEVKSTGKDWDGYALVKFRHTPGGGFETIVTWRVRDARDANVLPTVVATKVRQAIDQSSTD